MQEGAAVESKPYYGFGSVAWQQPPSQHPERAIPSYVAFLRIPHIYLLAQILQTVFYFYFFPFFCRLDMSKKGLARKLNYPGTSIGPYR